ncbi:MAG: hypothetical protein U1E76_05180 [Planctomycetota bacterium]
MGLIPLIVLIGQAKKPAVVAAPVVQGAPAGYRFIEVAHTKDTYKEFHGAPTLNATGITAFTATMDAGEKVIAFSSGGPPQFAVSTKDRFTNLDPTPVINDAWDVTFVGHIENQGSGVFFKPLGAEPTIVADTLFNFTRFKGTPDIDSRGQVVFYGEIDTRLPDGGIPIPEESRPEDFPNPDASEENPAMPYTPGMGIFINTQIQTLVVVDTLRSLEKVEPFVSLSETGSVAFIGTTRDKVRGLYVQPPGPQMALPIVDDSSFYSDFGPPVLTKQDELCFWAKKKDKSEAILVTQATGGQLREVVGSHEGEGRTFDPVIGHSDQGATLFIAREKGGPVLCLARRLGPPVRVIQRGSPLGGSAVEDIFIASRSVNDRGQFCFHVKFKNDEAAIYLATPTQ